MIRTLSALAVVAALASPAAAESTRVSIAGKDDQAIRADVHKAAKKVCNEAYLGDPVAAFHELNDCVADAETGAMVQVRAIERAAAAASRTDLAALAPPSPATGR
jgi:hypothetical protein